ncbi:MAG: adenosylmethionine--8-amino-7-oxononanoate transaminase [Alphaproteobacteria bacterium]
MSSVIWHPFTQHGLEENIISIESAEGCWLFPEQGTPILDAISSWWVITHGHGDPRLVKAISEQAARLDQVIFAGFTHPPAQELAQYLLKFAPKGLSKVFFTDSGSLAVEVALKMAVGAHYHHAMDHQQPPRTRILAMEHAYHGDSFGAMAVGARNIFSQSYDSLLFAVDRIPFPHPANEQASLAWLADYLQKHGTEVAAMIVEPLILGAGGMLMWRPEIFAQMVAMVRAHGIYVIADEVMTGWGRSGTLFACEQAGVVPDILCTAKGLTAGFLPLAATLCSEEIYQAFYSTSRARSFFHSSSFTANPLACAAAVANCKIWETDEPHTQIKRISGLHADFVKDFANKHHAVTRSCGVMAAIEFPADDAGYLACLGPSLRHWFLRHGVLLRPLGHVLYILPPYCTPTEELERVYELIDRAYTDQTRIAAA